MPAEADAGANAQQSAAGSQTDTAVSHKADIGTDEAQAGNVVSFSELCKIEAMESVRNARLMATQAITNSITTADMTAKQTLKAFELASDRQWNNDEVAALTAKLPTDLQGLSVLLSKAVADAISATKV